MFILILQPLSAVAMRDCNSRLSNQYQLCSQQELQQHKVAPNKHYVGFQYALLPKHLQLANLPESAHKLRSSQNNESIVKRRVKTRARARLLRMRIISYAVDDDVEERQKTGVPGVY